MLPRLTAQSGDGNEDSTGFSLQLYLKHREYDALLGAVGDGGGADCEDDIFSDALTASQPH